MEINNSVNDPNVNDPSVNNSNVNDPRVNDPNVNVNDQGNADSLDNRSRDLLIRHHQNARKREQGMMVRLGEEVGLPPEVAGQYGSEIQGKMPHNFSSYDRSGASSS